MDSNVEDRIKTELYNKLKDIINQEINNRPNINENRFKGLTSDNPANTCADIAPWRLDGHYWIIDQTDNTVHRVYCYLDGHSQCGNGVWMRTGYFNLTQGDACPHPLQRFQASGKWYCRRNVPRGCTSVNFNSHGHKYTEVCGMIEAYEYGAMHAFYHSTADMKVDDIRYVYGVSITHGQPPRSHIWTYAVGLHANPTNSGWRSSNCPCTKLGTTATLPNFLQNDYYCDSGNPTGYRQPFNILYPDQLWDNSGPSCVSGSTCCHNPNQPWFKKKLGPTTNDDVEFRWCDGDGDFSRATATRNVELYIRVA